MKMQHKLLNWCKALALPLVVWLVFVVLTKGRFAKPASVMNIFRTSVVPILLGMTLAFGMMMNMWNFASGAIVYACAIFGANLAKVTGTGIPGLCVFSILIGLTLSIVMGLVYRYTRVPCLVLSLGFAMFYEALPGIFAINGTGNINLLDGYLGGAPWCFVILIGMFLIFSYINSCTTLGANMRAVGANIKIADSAGIDIDRVKFASFVITGFFLGVAGIIMMSSNVSVAFVSGFASIAMIFDGFMGVFVAMVLTKYINFNVAVIIGTLTIRMLSFGLVTCGFSSEIRGIMTGIFLFVVISYSANAGKIDMIRARKRIAAEADAEYAAMH